MKLCQKKQKSAPQIKNNKKPVQIIKKLEKQKKTSKRESLTALLQGQQQMMTKAEEHDHFTSFCQINHFTSFCQKKQKSAPQIKNNKKPVQIIKKLEKQKKTSKRESLTALLQGQQQMMTKAEEHDHLAY